MIPFPTSIGQGSKTSIWTMNKHQEALSNSLVSCAQITNNWQRTAWKRKRRKANMGWHFIMGLYFGTRQVQTLKLEDCSSKLGCALNWLFEEYFLSHLPQREEVPFCFSDSAERQSFVPCLRHPVKNSVIFSAKNSKEGACLQVPVALLNFVKGLLETT